MSIRCYNRPLLLWQLVCDFGQPAISSQSAISQTEWLLSNFAMHDHNKVNDPSWRYTIVYIQSFVYFQLKFVYFIRPEKFTDLQKSEKPFRWHLARTTPNPKSGYPRLLSNQIQPDWTILNRNEVAYGKKWIILFILIFISFWVTKTGPEFHNSL